MAIFRKLIKFFDRNYWLFLGLIVLISYGQILFMQPWEDDNALFFKLTNIEGRAGYLGEGPLGSRPYKYTVTPYIPIYQLFGYNTIPYFALGLFLYFLSAFAVYKALSVFDKKAGKLAGFLYASGYVASDGIIRLFNSIVTSVSVILLSLLFYFYWKFFTSRKAEWYIFALLVFFLATELASARTHYLIAIIVVFELLFLSFEKPFKSLASSILRLLPFALIFYQYFLLSADPRSGQVKNLFLALARGEFYQTYSLVTSFANITIPDWLTGKLFIGGGVLEWLILFSTIMIAFLLFKKHSYKKILFPIFTIVMVIWKFAVSSIYFSPALNLGDKQFFIAFLGGIIFLLSLVVFIALKDIHRKIYVFFLSWAVLNIAAYAAYNPFHSYESINRYFTHSFFAWVSLLGILYLAFKNTIWKRIFLGAAILWGVGNISSSLAYQQRILSFRSNPVRDFYTQLKSYVPAVQKGDVFYFDVSEDARSYFRDAFSVAQMPEETAIAWRYGVDRYDIRRITQFDDLVKLFSEGSFTDKEKNKVPLNNVYTFFYSRDGLIYTSDEMGALLQGTTIETLIEVSKEEVVSGNIVQGITLNFEKPVTGLVPQKLTMSLKASPIDITKLTFPYQGIGQFVKEITTNDQQIRLAFAYEQEKKEILRNSKFISSSEWRDRETVNIHDGNLDTIWQPDRVLWPKGKENLIIDLGTILEINRFAWINGFPSNTPRRYIIDTSLDGERWQKAKEVNSVTRIDSKEPQVVDFGTRRARYIRISFLATLSGDSPGIAEAWIITSRFSSLNIFRAEKYLQNPFAFIPSKDLWLSVLKLKNYKGKVQYGWLSDKSENWITNGGAYFELNYDGRTHRYNIIIPASGTQVKKIKIYNQEIPGTIDIESIQSQIVPPKNYQIK